MPYRDVLLEFKFERVWYFNKDGLIRERHEHRFGEDSKQGVLWVFLESRDVELDWSIGLDGGGGYSLVSCAVGAQRQEQDPFFVFNDMLQKTLAAPL